MKIYHIFLIFLRKLYYLFFFDKSNKDNTFVSKTDDAIYDPELASKKVFELLISKNPCMIARLGQHETNVFLNYLSINSDKKSIINFIKYKSNPWWWNTNNFKFFQKSAGFFPINISLVEKYCKLTLLDLNVTDILGIWPSGIYENLFNNDLKKITRIRKLLIEPFFSNKPWTKALEGKKVLVIHPFQNTIEQQYKKRKLLFKNNLLPDFDLKTIKAVTSYLDEKTEFKTWFDALDSMKKQMDQIDYDIALIGCGAYGFNLAAHAKKSGKKSVHLGGALQILFGIIGSRFENPLVADGIYLKLFNEHWVRPSNEEKPKSYKSFEGGAYW